jgi:hypothetical protein
VAVASSNSNPPAKQIRAVRDPTVSLRPLPARLRAKPKPKPDLVWNPRWITLPDLKPGMCRLVRDGDGIVESCGAATQSLSSSWCPAHKLICYAQREARP